jgi:hypothetical protein
VGGVDALASRPADSLALLFGKRLGGKERNPQRDRPASQQPQLGCVGVGGEHAAIRAHPPARGLDPHAARGSVALDDRAHPAVLEQLRLGPDRRLAQAAHVLAQSQLSSPSSGGPGSGAGSSQRLGGCAPGLIGRPDPTAICPPLSTGALYVCLAGVSSGPPGQDRRDHAGRGQSLREPVRHGYADVRAVSRDAIDAFSRRRAEILEFLDGRGQGPEQPDAAQQAAYETRRRKSAQISPSPGAC